MNQGYPIIQDRTNFTSEDYLHLNSCGVNAGDVPFVTYRPQGRVDWHILYQLSGEFTAEYEGEALTLTPGDLLIYPPHVPHLYTYPPGSRTAWLHFAGTAAERVMPSLGLDGGIRRGTLDPLVVETFDHLRGLGGTDPADLTVQNGVLLTLLGFLARNARGERANFAEALAPGIRLMREEYARPVSIAACAALCHMSESSFVHQFRERMGVPPYRFLQDIRMEKACDLLQHTGLSISAIAALCGYADPLYFSRVFRKAFGLSPRAWRP